MKGVTTFFTWWKRAAIAACALGGTAALTATSLTSCAQTPTNVPVRTFERPQSVDVVCLQVLDPTNHNAPVVPPKPVAQAFCAPVPVNVDGTLLPYHLYALVTQTTRGELAVVDLTGGYVIDTDPGTPGINFLPVGKLPSDVAVAPDGKMAFVGSAAPNAPAIYALPTTLILGDSQGATPDGGVNVIPQLTTWPVCALPQAPGAIAIVPTSALGGAPSGAGAASDAGGDASDDAGDSSADAGASAEAGADAGAPAANAGPGYVIVAVLPGDSTNPARVVTIDPAPLLRGAAPYVPGPNVDPSGPVVLPGSLTACPVLTYVNLEAPAQATTWTEGPRWDDGVKYVDGGRDAELPQTGTACATANAPVGDAGGDAGATPPVAPSPGKLLFSGAVAAPRGGHAVLDSAGTHEILYVADVALPIIHVLDVSDPLNAVELAPLLATSLIDPSRTVSVGAIAVSPTTRDFKRFLYAIDQKQGSIIVYDVTDPATTSRTPLTRPHPELNPFQSRDRISFGAPVAALSFVRHDFPLTFKGTTALLTAETGLLCNPNPKVDPSGAAIGTSPPADQGPFTKDDGAYYRNNAGNQPVGLGPSRLRGVFAFATLSNGQVVTIDVDDWDAPCRRPDPLAPRGTFGDPIVDELVAGPFSAIAPPEPPPSSDTDFDPYHAPLSHQTYDTASPVSLEEFFPVAPPHRARSQNILRADATNGTHAPILNGVPQLFTQGAPVATTGDQGVANPDLVPTDTRFVDPSLQSNPAEADPAKRTSVLVLSGGVSTADGGVAAGSSLTLAQSAPGATPGVRFAFEDPEVHIDQDWQVTYEGKLPGFFDGNGNPLVLASVAADPNAAGDEAYETVSLSNRNAIFCRKGIEDAAIGTQRAQAQLKALADAGLPTIPRLDHRVADYVQLTDGILDSSDPYWGLDNDCWSDIDSAGAPGTGSPAALNRAAVCSSTYGPTLDATNPSTQRDFPIVEAYDDHLVLGRYGYQPGQQTASSPREVVGKDPSNRPFLKLMKCCFHNEVHFNVRTGSQWSAIGSAVSFLHHIASSGSNARCTPECEAREALLNARSAAVPRPPPMVKRPNGAPLCAAAFVPSIDRDSALALRNPMFSFLVWNGQDPTSCADLTPVRDMLWKFATRGQYAVYTINLAATTTALSPQTMRFIDSLGQLAIIDGESQGLILIDLNTMAPAHSPFF